MPDGLRSERRLNHTGPNYTLGVLQPNRNGLQPTSDGLQTKSDDLRPTSDGKSDGLQPTSDGSLFFNWSLPKNHLFIVIFTLRHQVM